MTADRAARRSRASSAQRLLRREDPALLTGEARFTDDLDIPGALHLAVAPQPVRPRPHHVHRHVGAPRRCPASSPSTPAPTSPTPWAAPMPCAWPVTDDMKNPAHYPLADRQGVLRRRRRRRRARRHRTHRPRDALDADRRRATSRSRRSSTSRTRCPTGSSSTTTSAPTRSYTWDAQGRGHDGAVDAAFADAAHTVSERYVQQRLIPMAMEPRAVRRRAPAVRRRHHAVLGDPDPAHPQGHVGDHARHPRAPGARRRPGGRRRLRRRSSTSTPRSCCAWRSPASTACPVRWIEERTENAHGHHPRPRPDPGHRARRRRRRQAHGGPRRLLADMGAYLQLVTPGIPLLGAFLYAGVYDLPAAYDFACTSVFTTMTPTDAYRGAGRPEATYAIERAMDALAAQGRRRPARAAPAQLHPDRRSSRTRRGSGLDLRLRRPRRPRPTRPLELVGYDALRGRAGRRQNVDGRHQAPRHRHLVVLRDVRPGAVSRVLASLNYSAGGWEAATVRVLPTAKVQVVTGTDAARPGPRDVVVDDRRRPARRQPRRRRRAALRHGDQPRSGMDTYGSRSLAVGGVAIAMACDKVIDKARQIAAHQLEASADDLEFAGGAFTRAGLARQDDAARRRSPSRRSPPTTSPTALEPNLEAQVTYDPPNFSWPFGTHICVVEVDDRDRRGRRPAVRRRRRLRQRRSTR